MGRPGKFYKGVLAAEPGADDRRRAEPRIMAQREARQSPPYFDLTTSWSKDISIFHASLGAAVKQARDEVDRRGEALTAVLLAEVGEILRDANNAALLQGGDLHHRMKAISLIPWELCEHVVP